MITSNKLPKNSTTFNEDFTVKHYRQLLRAARASYRFATYDAIPWDTRFVLWRHDLDYSINRAAALAGIEAEEDVTATYFVNPSSEYYNPFEPGQAQLIKHILNLGHRLGLHFDAAFHDIQDEDALHRKVAQEGRWLAEAFGVLPTVFSFHNPGAAQLQSDAENYGGLINCYSRRFKAEIPYCSDSNGYWRFRRLHDVLTDATDPCLQVLTHPGWWQEKPMPPRQRIFRSVYGRAASTLRAYDANLELHDRTNHAGAATHLRFLKTAHPRLFELCDYLWNSCHFQSLFVELWRLHETQINKLCKAELRKQWRVPAFEVNAFFESPSLAIDGWRLFAGVFGRSWQDAASLEKSEYQAWVDLRNTLIHGRSSTPSQRLEDGCVFLCSAIESLSSWGKTQLIHYDGIDHLGSIGIPTCKTADGSLTDRLEEVADDIQNFPLKKWELFKVDILKVGAGGTAQASVL
jgi:hypothetical protein